MHLLTGCRLERQVLGHAQKAVRLRVRDRLGRTLRYPGTETQSCPHCTLKVILHNTKPKLPMFGDAMYSVMYQTVLSAF